jgi:DNA-3-methyladenine glycosylase II
MTVKPIPPFDFELSATIFSGGDPQIRKYEKERFWQVIRVGSKPMLTIVTTAGTIDEPRLSVRLESNRIISQSDIEDSKGIVCSLFNLDFDLKPFYEQAKEDRVMAGLTCRLRGLKSPTTPTVFEALIDSIVEQQISLNIANKMEGRLIKAFGEVLSLDKEVYYAFPTPQELASASIQTLQLWAKSEKSGVYL